MEEERIKKFPSELAMSDGDDEEEEIAATLRTRYESNMSDSRSTISSTALSRTATPDELNFGLDVGRGDEVDLEKVDQDVARRGIIKPKGTDCKYGGNTKASPVDNTPVNKQETVISSNPDISVAIEDDILANQSAVTPIDLYRSDSRPSTASSVSTVDIPIKTVEPNSRNHVPSEGSEFVIVGDRETSFITRSGDVTVELSSTCTQTENSWLKDIELYEELMQRRPDWINEINVKRKESKSSTGSSKSVSILRRRKKSISRTGTPASPLASESRPRSVAEQQEEQEAMEEKEPKLPRESSSPKSRQSGGSSLPQTPNDVLYRPPTVMMSSGSSSEDEHAYTPDDKALIPSIGPPAILQYVKESQHPPMMNEEVGSREDINSDFLKKSVFTGPCMFCKKEVFPFPTEEELEDVNLKPSDLFCCSQYERFIKFELSQRDDKSHLRDELIDIKPHPPYGTKAARKAAKERATERAQAREMERQKAAGVNATNFYALARQMKTITYSLASTKCMEEGWTVKPTTPVPADSEQPSDPFLIEVNPIQQQRRAFLERFYESGQRFLIVLPDGSGCCYYPSGNIAVIISTTEKGKFTYIAFEDNNDYEKTRSGMLAVFDPSGHGTCYFRNGTVRMVLDPYGGVLLDNQGARKKKWLWHNLKIHVHAPPFQPITFSITKQLSVRCLTQDKVILTFNQGKYTARFNVGSKLKAVRTTRPPLERDDYEIHLAEVKQFINILLDRTQNALRLPNYPRLDKIPLPLRLQKAKEAQRGKMRSLRTSSQADTTTVTVN